MVDTGLATKARLIQYFVHGRNPQMGPWFYEQMHSHSNPVRFHATGSVVTAINSASTVDGVNSAIASMGSTYGFQMLFPTSPRPAGDRYQWTPYGNTNATDVALVKVLARFAVEEWSKYPPAFVKDSDLILMAWARNLLANGSPSRGAAYNDQALFSVGPDAADALNSEEHNRGIIHHEFWHIVDGADINGGVWNNHYVAQQAEWNAACAWPYGSVPTLSTDHPLSFVTDYAHWNIVEDRAETHAYLMLRDRYNKVMRWTGGAVIPDPTATPDPAGEYRYYRFRPTRLRTDFAYIQMMEFGVLNGASRLSPVSVSQSTPWYTSPSGQDPGKASDNSLTTKWLSKDGYNSNLIYDFGTKARATGYRWATGEDYPERDPLSWAVEGSQNKTSWTLLDARTNYATPTARQTYTPDLALTQNQPTTPPPVATPGVDGGLATKVRLQKEFLAARDPLLDSTFHARINSYTNPLRFYTITSILNAINAATTIAGVEAAFAPMGTEYGFTLQFPTTSGGDPSWWNVTWDPYPASDLAEVKVVARYFAEEFAKYPGRFVAATTINFFTVAKNYRYLVNGVEQSPPAAAQGHRIMFKFILDGKLPSVDALNYRGVIHHEYMHVIEGSFSSAASAQYGEWDAANPAGFTYGQRPFVDADHPPSFTDDYARTSRGEDRAQVHAILMQQPRFNMAMRWTGGQVLPEPTAAADPNSEYRFYRFRPTKLRTAFSFIQMAEFALLNGTTRLTGMTVSATNNNSPVGQEPSKAADNTLTGSKWLSFLGYNSTLVYDFGTKTRATGYRWATAGDATGRDSLSWVIEGSQNGTSWTFLHDRVDYATTTSRDTYLPDFYWTAPTTPPPVTGSIDTGLRTKADLLKTFHTSAMPANWHAQVNSFTAPYRAYNTASVESAINSATTVAGVISAMGPFNSAYGMTAEFPTAPDPDDYFRYTVWTNADLEAVKYYAKLHVREFSKYPAQHVTDTVMQFVRWYKAGFTYGGDAANQALGAAFSTFLVIDALWPPRSFSDTVPEGVLHHEFQHIRDATWNPDRVAQQAQWEAANSRPYGDQSVASPLDHTTSFVSAYSQTNYGEDRAELNMWLMNQQHYNQTMGWTGGQILLEPSVAADPAGAYRFYRFRPTKLRTDFSYVRLSEFALLNGSTRLTGMTAIEEFKGSSAWPPVNAADNVTSTQWIGTEGVAARLIYDFGTKVTATGYRWATDISSTTGDPLSWVIEGSQDRVSWRALDTQTNYATPTARSTYLPDFGLAGAPVVPPVTPPLPANSKDPGLARKVELIKAYVQARNSSMGATYHAQVNAATNPLRFYNPASTISAVNAATTIPAVQQAMLTMGNAYGVTFGFPTTPNLAGELVQWGGTGLVPADLPTVKQVAVITAEEFAKYPPAFMLASGLIDFWWVKPELSYNGVPNPPTAAFQIGPRIYAEVVSGVAAQVYRRRIHHELQHAFDRVDWATHYQGQVAAWDAANPAGFTYGTMLVSQDTHTAGFCRGYGQTSRLEDRADVAGWLMAQPYYAEITDWVAPLPVAPPTAALAVTMSNRTATYDTAGTQSSDGAPFTRGIAWGDGITTGNAPTVGTYTYAQPGTYTITLTVTSGGLSSTSTQTVVASNPVVAPPTAQLAVTVAARVATYDTTGSGSSDGAPFTRSINWGDGVTTVNAPITGTHTYAAAGSYTATLTVTSGTLQSTASRPVTVTDAPPVAPPVAVLSVSIVNRTATYNATGSGSSDGAPFTRAIAWGDGATSNPAPITGSHTYATPGAYTITLTVTSGGQSTVTSRPVTASVAATVYGTAVYGTSIYEAVSSSTPAPTAQLTLSVTNLAVTYDASGSGTPDGRPYTRTVAWGDGTTTTSAAVTGAHTYAVVGTYTITLTVTAVGDGQTATATRTVDLATPPIPPPVVPPPVVPPPVVPPPVTPGIPAVPGQRRAGATWAIHPREPDLTRLYDPVSRWTKLTLVERWNVPTTWTIEGPADALSAFTVGSGCILDRDGQQVASGTVKNVSRVGITERGRRIDSLTVACASDLDRLGGRVVFPTAAHVLLPTVTRFPDAAEVRTGPAESIILGFVDTAFGPSSQTGRRIPKLVIPPSFGRGSQTTVTGRLDSLGPLIQSLGDTSGLRVDVVHVENPEPALVLSVTSTADRSSDIRFGDSGSASVGTVTSYTYDIGAPTVTRAIVAGGGEGAARTFVQVIDVEAEALWGAVREVVVDQRQADPLDDFWRIESSLAEMNAIAVAILANLPSQVIMPEVLEIIAAVPGPYPRGSIAARVNRVLEQWQVQYGFQRGFVDRVTEVTDDVEAMSTEALRDEWSAIGDVFLGGVEASNSDPENVGLALLAARDELEKPAGDQTVQAVVDHLNIAYTRLGYANASFVGSAEDVSTFSTVYSGAAAAKKDGRIAVTTEELTRAGQEALADGAGPRDVSFSVAPGADIDPPRDCPVGTIVGVDLPGLEPLDDRVREVTTEVTVAGGRSTETVTLTVGTMDAGKARSQRQVASALRRVGAVERAR